MRINDIFLDLNKYIQEEKENSIKDLIKKKLDAAEETWSLNERNLVVSNESYQSISKSVSTYIPGHEFVDINEDRVSEFVALVIDMRESSKHLVESVLNSGGRIEKLQRVYYEVSALLPALELSISFENGVVTEYLGDGVLALFRVEKDSEKEIIRKALDTAYYCIDTTLRLVNSELNRRYNLPSLSIGAGLSYGPALVTILGADKNFHPKAFGECVFKASKLSSGSNEIYADNEFMGVLDINSPYYKNSIRVNGLKAYSLSR